jgi:hypothetical protein
VSAEISWRPTILGVSFISSKDLSIVCNIPPGVRVINPNA